MNAPNRSPQGPQLRPTLSWQWRGALIILIPVICLLTSVVAIATLRGKTIDALAQEQQSQQALRDIDRLMIALVNAEIGVRGYMITQRVELLTTYLEANTQISQSLNILKTSKQALQTPQQVQAISNLIEQQTALLAQILETSKIQRATTGDSPTLTAQLIKSKQIRDRLTQEIAELAQQEARTLAQSRASVAQWRQWITAVQWVALVGGVLGAGAAIYLFNQLDRELVEQATRLRENNVYLQSVFDNVLDAILILNERGYIQSANATAEEIFGYEPDALPGKHLQRLIAESFTDDSGKAMNQLVGKNQDKLRLQQETMGRKQDGTTFPMEFAITQMPLDNGRLLIVILRDITERKQITDTLLEQAQLLDLANDSIMVLDLNETITYWNQGAQRLYGFSADEAIGQSIHTLLHPQFPQPLQAIKAIVGRDGYWQGEMVQTKRDGTRVTVASGWTLQRDEFGNPMAYLEINQDITERKQAEAALKKSEELYRTLVQNFPNGAVFLFDHDLRYTIAEGTALGTVNLSAEELTGKTIWETLPPETVQILEPMYREALAGKATVTEIPFADQIYRIYVLPVKNERGQVFAGMTMTQDITESKKAEKALRNRADELARLTAVLAQTTANLEKRNSELDRFAYIVSHDLKAPLRAIANLSQWLEEDLAEQLTEDTRHQMNLLRGRVYRMEALINGLLQYSRVGRIRTELELVDVEALLADVIDSLAPPPNVTITLMPEMPTLWTERLPLEQVFANLISNAIKHNPQTNRQVVISVAENTDYYQFAVADNGPGIAPEFHEKVFVMFQTLESKDKVDNTGVGLAIVKKIIEDQGGSLSLESEPGQGATFRFTWPKQPIKAMS